MANLDAQITAHLDDLGVLTTRLSNMQLDVRDHLLPIVAALGDSEAIEAINSYTFPQLEILMRQVMTQMDRYIKRVGRTLTGVEVAAYNGAAAGSAAPLMIPAERRVNDNRGFTNINRSPFSRVQQIDGTRLALNFLLSLNQDTLILVDGNTPITDRRTGRNLINNGSRNVRNPYPGLTFDESRDKHPFYLPRCGTKERNYVAPAPDRKLMLPRVGGRDPSASWLPVDRLTDSACINLRFPYFPIRPRNCSGGGETDDKSGANGEFAIYLGTTSSHSHLQNQIPTIILISTNDIDWDNLLAILDAPKLPAFGPGNHRHMGNYVGQSDCNQANAALATIIHYFRTFSHKTGGVGAVTDLRFSVAHCLATRRSVSPICAPYGQREDYVPSLAGPGIFEEAVIHGYSYCSGSPTYIAPLDHNGGRTGAYRLLYNGQAKDTDHNLRRCFALNMFNVQLFSPSTVFNATVHRPEDVNNWHRRQSEYIFLG